MWGKSQQDEASEFAAVIHEQYALFWLSTENVPHFLFCLPVWIGIFLWSLSLSELEQVHVNSKACRGFWPCRLVHEYVNEPFIFFLSFSFLPSSAGLELLRLLCIIRYIGRYHIMWYALFCPLSSIDFRGSALAFIYWLFCMVWGKWWACACWCLLLISSLLNLAEMSHPLFHFWPLHLPIIDFMKGRWELCDLSSFFLSVNWITIQILWTTPIISGLSNPCIHAEPSAKVSNWLALIIVHTWLLPLS